MEEEARGSGRGEGRGGEGRGGEGRGGEGREGRDHTIVEKHNRTMSAS